MLSKCANPSCSSRLQRLTEGKLFLVESTGVRNPGLVDCRKKSPRRIEYFWLCKPCSSVLTLTADSCGGIEVLPLRRMERSQAATAEG
jgi:hypothetical protein